MPQTRPSRAPCPTTRTCRCCSRTATRREQVHDALGGPRHPPAALLLAGAARAELRRAAAAAAGRRRRGRQDPVPADVPRHDRRARSTRSSPSIVAEPAMSRSGERACSRCAGRRSYLVSWFRAAVAPAGTGGGRQLRSAGRGDGHRRRQSRRAAADVRRVRGLRPRRVPPRGDRPASCRCSTSSCHCWPRRRTGSPRPGVVVAVSSPDVVATCRDKLAMVAAVREQHDARRPAHEPRPARRRGVDPSTVRPECSSSRGSAPDRSPRSSTTEADEVAVLHRKVSRDLRSTYLARASATARAATSWCRRRCRAGARADRRQRPRRSVPRGARQPQAGDAGRRDGRRRGRRRHDAARGGRAPTRRDARPCRRPRRRRVRRR